MARAPKVHSVTIANTGATLPCRADQTVLEAAVAAGIDYPYTCASGNCGSCVSELQAGKVAMLPYGDGALGAAQRRAGRVLACRARPRSDATLLWLGRGRS